MERLKRIRCFLLDMDGTIYLAGRVFPETVPFLDMLTDRSIRYLFLTNNSSLSAGDYRKKLKKMSIPVSSDGVFTSGDATAVYLKKQGVSRVYLLGTGSLRRDFRRCGIAHTEKDPEAVVLGFDLTLTYAKLKKANDLICSGVPFYATHPDLVCPFHPHPLPDAGAMAKLLEASSGKTPTVIGKPYAPMADALIERYGLSRGEIAMVGDRLYTDIRFGTLNGFASILVLSGETTRAMADAGDIRPDYIFDDIGALGKAIAT
ncbi:MAG: HAD-IIA family hydrolase [Spirochaetes bacterium]|nr:HAD-IIA family hydrolase [Spirochaetota bacterium]